MSGFSTLLATEARRFWDFANELHAAKMCGSRKLVAELRDELEAMAMHSDYPAIRRACQGVLATA